jgi:hypothetical protein
MRWKFFDLLKITKRKFHALTLQAIIQSGNIAGGLRKQSGVEMKRGK